MFEPLLCGAHKRSGEKPTLNPLCILIKQRYILEFRYMMLWISRAIVLIAHWFKVVRERILQHTSGKRTLSCLSPEYSRPVCMGYLSGIVPGLFFHSWILLSFYPLGRIRHLALLFSSSLIFPCRHFICSFNRAISSPGSPIQVGLEFPTGTADILPFCLARSFSPSLFSQNPSSSIPCSFILF